MILKYNAVKKSAHPSEPPGCPLWHPCTILKMSLLTCEAVSVSNAIPVNFIGGKTIFISLEIRLKLERSFGYIFFFGIKCEKNTNISKKVVIYVQNLLGAKPLHYYVNSSNRLNLFVHFIFGPKSGF
jgi:hypothetical protein